MKDTVYVLVFEGFADWEPALAMCELNKHEKIQVVTVGFSEEPVRSLGGMKVVPDTTIPEMVPGKALVFIIPGGEMWEKEEDHEDLKDVLPRLREAQVPIAAICGATLALARMGMFSGVKHTSNSKEYVKLLAPEYRDEDNYVEELAVRDGGIITASGAGYVEFACEIIKELGLYKECDQKAWFDLFKHGILPGDEAIASP
jgi:putative intracellular protease/amidase